VIHYWHINSLKRKEAFVRVIYLSLLVAMISILSLATGAEAVAEDGYDCSCYLATITTEYESFSDYWEICPYDGEAADIYTLAFLFMYGFYGDLGTDHKRLIGYGDGEYGCPGAVSLSFDGPRLLKGDGICDNIIYRVEGQRIDCGELIE